MSEQSENTSAFCVIDIQGTLSHTRIPNMFLIYHPLLTLARKVPNCQNFPSSLLSRDMVPANTPTRLKGLRASEI